MVILLLSGCYNSVSKKSTTVTVGEQDFLCEVVSTEEAREQGLMFRDELEQNQGMLFDFQKESMPGFWMKNTAVPLDIVWIDAKKRVVKILTATPCTEDPCETFHAETSARWVLEVNAHAFPGNVGDRVEFDL